MGKPDAGLYSTAALIGPVHRNGAFANPMGTPKAGRSSQTHLNCLLLAAALLATVLLPALLESQGRAPIAATSQALRAVLISPSQASSIDFLRWSKKGVNSVVLMLSDDESKVSQERAIRRIHSTGMDLYYWIEIARNPALADAYPEWMASLQGHSEWRRHFPGFPTPSADEVVKNYPWVPILYREAFGAHLKRLSKLLQQLPAAKGIFLNDLQAAPSACGCGNSLCRWTPDYGPIRTATRLPADAAFRFAEAVARQVSPAEIIPVWTTECEEGDGTKDGPCAGVGCFAGLCWKEYTAQLMPVTQRFDRLGVLLPFRAIGRDLPRYGPTAGWVSDALRSFQKMPPKHQGSTVAVNRLIPVLQGWDVTLEEQQAQVARSQQMGAMGYVLALSQIDQSWEPRIIKLPK